jgi:hypothetical protein
MTCMRLSCWRARRRWGSASTSSRMRGMTSSQRRCRKSAGHRRRLTAWRSCGLRAAKGGRRSGRRGRGRRMRSCWRMRRGLLTSRLRRCFLWRKEPFQRGVVVPCPVNSFNRVAVHKSFLRRLSFTSFAIERARAKIWLFDSTMPRSSSKNGVARARATLHILIALEARIE